MHFLFNKIIINWTVFYFLFCLGLPRDLAYRLASQTVLGAGQLVRDSGIHPGKLKDDVTSPAGSTASGLWHLEANCMYFIMELAIFFFSFHINDEFISNF